MAEIDGWDRVYVSEIIHFGKRDGKAAKLLIITVAYFFCLYLAGVRPRRAYTILVRRVRLTE